MNMKTTKNTITMKVYRLAIMVMMAVLPALSGAWQAQAVTYHPLPANSQRSYYNRPATSYGMQSAPSVSFQTSGSMMNTGSAYSSNPMIGTNGQAYSPSTRIGGIRKTGEYDDTEDDDEYGGNAGTPGGTVEENDQLPIGDAVLPLMLLACAYLILRATRRRREIEE